MLYTRPDDFYVTQLSIEEHKAYDIIVKELLELKQSFSLKGVRIDNPRESFPKITNAVAVSRPDIFYESPHIQYSGDIFGNYNITYHFVYNRRQILQYRAMLNKICSDFVKSVSGYHSEYEIILAINRYLSEHVVYSGEMDVEGGSSVGALIKGNARCEGIAQAFKLLADAVGITSFIAVGQASTDHGRENHSWNIVRFRGKYYHVDPTYNIGTKDFGAPFDCPLFFMMSDEQVSRTHFGGWNYPKCLDSSQEFFTKNGLSVKKPEDMRFLPPMEKEEKKYFFARLEWGPSNRVVADNCVRWLSEPCRKKGIIPKSFCYDEEKRVLRVNS